MKEFTPECTVYYIGFMIKHKKILEYSKKGNMHLLLSYKFVFLKNDVDILDINRMSPLVTYLYRSNFRCMLLKGDSWSIPNFYCSLVQM